MKLKRKCVGILLLVLLLNACASKSGWQTDYDSAFDQARRQKKDVVLFFSRIDTDSMSQNLKQNIFDTEAFINAAKERFVLINIDLPGTEAGEDGSETPDQEQREKNNRTAQRYSLQSLPTVLLLTFDGDVYGTILYDESITTPEQYMEKMASFDPRRVERQELKDRIMQASGGDRARLIDELCTDTDDAYVPLLAPYFRQISELDPDNALGLREKYEFFIVNQDALDLYNDDNPAGAADLFIAAVSSPWLSFDQKVSAYNTAIGLYISAGEGYEDQMIDALFGFAEMTSGSPGYRERIESSAGVDRVKAIDEFINAIDPNYQMFLGDYISQVPSLDPENTLGLRGKYELMHAYTTAQEYYTAEDMQNASRVFMDIAESPFLSAAERLEAYQMAAMLLPFEAPEDAAPIIELLEKAIAADPENEGVSMLRYALEQIRMMQAAMPPAAEPAIE